MKKPAEVMPAGNFKRDVSYDDDGFTIASQGKPLLRARWADVRQVSGFKHDLFSIDEICMGFQLDDDEAGQFAWAGELDGGFQEFRAEVERRFGIAPEWFTKVMLPAFRENRTLLRSRR